MRRSGFPGLFVLLYNGITKKQIPPEVHRMVSPGRKMEPKPWEDLEENE